jgi:hypothetical protein
VAAIKALVGTFVSSARYLTADLDLFQDRDVFSRFQLVPNRSGFTGQPFPNDAAPQDDHGTPPVGEAALAGTDLLALSGWCARPFRVHDFLLGRMNMAVYLRREFILRADNPLFDKWPLDMRQGYCLQVNGDRLTAPITAETPGASYYLPIIPMPADNFGVQPPTWPQGALDPSTLEGPIADRAEAALGTLRADNAPGFGGWLIASLALGGISNTLAGDAVAALKVSLARRNLWPKVGEG